MGIDVTEKEEIGSRKGRDEIFEETWKKIEVYDSKMSVKKGRLSAKEIG